MKRFHHPLSINLTTKNVWCELCSIRVSLESNVPSLDSKFSKKIELCNGNGHDEHNTVDNYKLIEYLDTEKSKSNKFMQQKYLCIKLVEF